MVEKVIRVGSGGRLAGFEASTVLTKLEAVSVDDKEAGEIESGDGSRPVAAREGEEEDREKEEELLFVEPCSRTPVRPLSGSIPNPALATTASSCWLD